MTRDEWRARLEARADEAERYGTTAPRATVLRAILDELAAVDGLPTDRTAPPRLLTLQEAADRLGVTPRYLSDHRKELPFLRRLTPGGTVRVEEAALMKWLTARGSK